MNATTDDMAGLQFAIAQAEEAAQNAEDNERIAVASKHRAKARALKAQLAALSAGEVAS